MSLSSRKIWLWIIPLLLLITWLGARDLNASGIWSDEWWSIYDAGGFDPNGLSPVQIWDRIAAEDYWQAPGYSWALALWGAGMGWTEYAARAFSLLAGVLTVAVTYRLGLSISGKRLVGLAAALALGMSAWFLFYLHEMRVYTLYLLLITLAMLLYWRLMSRRSNSALAYVAFALVLAALAYTQYFALISLVLLGVFHLFMLLRGRPDRRWFIILGCIVLSGVVFLPWVANVLKSIPTLTDKPRQVFDTNLMVQMAGNVIYAFSSGATALVLLVIAASLSVRRSWVIGLLVVVLTAVQLAVMVKLSLGELRYLLSAVPLLALMVGFGVQVLAERRIQPTLFFALFIGSTLLIYHNPDFENTLQYSMFMRRAIREAANVLESHLQPDDIIIDHLGDVGRGEPEQIVTVQYFGLRPVEIIEPEGLPTTAMFAQRVEQAVQKGDRFWVLYSPLWPSQDWGLFNHLLEERSIISCSTLYTSPDMNVFGYGRLASDAARFGDAIGVNAIGAPLVQDGKMTIWLGFRVAESVPGNTYSVTVHVLDAGGQLAAQSDFPLPQADYSLPPLPQSCQLVQIPVEALAAGDYRVELLIYNWATGERLTLNDGSGEALNLADVAINR